MSSSPTKVPLPESSKNEFELKGSLGAALLLHGFTSTPYEMRVVGERLSQANIFVRAPVLPGHATSPRDLDHIDENEWIDCAREELRSLPQGKPKAIVAASMGGLLALHCAAQDSAVRALVLLAPALSFNAKSRLGFELGALEVFKGREIKKSKEGSDIADAHARELNPAYKSIPFGGLGALGRLRESTLELLPRVRCPILIFHGAKDHTVESEASHLVAARTKAPYIEHHRLPHSQHVLGIDVDRAEIAERTSAFLTRVFA